MRCKEIVLKSCGKWSTDNINTYKCSTSVKAWKDDEVKEPEIN